MSDSESDDEFFDFDETFTLKYYAIAVPNGKAPSGFVFTSMVDAQRKLKEYPGSRMKIFFNPISAERFSLNPLTPQRAQIDNNRINENSTSRISRDVCAFPSVSQRDLNVLKLAIEREQVDKIQEIIWNNPRHLVTESDSPTVLQAGCRYNALHVAAFHGKALSVGIILKKLRDKDILRSLYPSVDEAAQLERQQRLLDMYLNTPETGKCETPLHFACKFCHVACVRELIKQPEINVNVRNKSQETPEQSIGSRWNGSQEELNNRRKEILFLLHQRFVYMRKRCDHNSLQSPICDPVSLHELQNILNSQDKEDPIVLSYAGPLTPEDADRFCEEWRNPTRLPLSVRECLRQVRRTDSEKGLERTGRYLARAYGTEWKEYWYFLKDYLDFASPEGLQKLEEHLAEVKISLNQINSQVLTTSDDSLLPGVEDVPSNADCVVDLKQSTPKKSNNSKTSSSLSLSSFSITQLTSLFSRLQLWETSRMPSQASTSPQAPPQAPPPSPSLSTDSVHSYTHATNYNKTQSHNHFPSPKLQDVNHSMGLKNGDNSIFLSPLFSSSPQTRNKFSTSKNGSPFMNNYLRKAPRMNYSVSFPTNSSIQYRTKDDIQVYTALRPVIYQSPYNLDPYPHILAWKEQMDHFAQSEANIEPDLALL